MGTILLHVVHGVIVVAGALVVLALLLPDLRDVRAMRNLREAAAAGTLEQCARHRAEAELRGEFRGEGLTWRFGAALASLAAAVVHAAVGPEHFREGWRFGVFFVLLSLAQLAFAPLVVRRPSAALLRVNLAVTIAAVAVWAMTRTVGLPFGLAEVEPVGRLDVTATAAELVTMVCCLALLLAPPLLPKPHTARHTRRELAGQP